MSNIAKQTAPSKTVAKHRSDTSRIGATKASSTSTVHPSTKGDATTKRKIAKENGIQHTIDEKKSEKKNAPTTNAKQKIPTDNKQKHEKKSKSDGKATTMQAAKSVGNKKVLAIEKADPKRPTDKLKSKSLKDSKSKAEPKETVKSTKSNESSKISSKVSKSVKPSAKNEIVSKIPKASSKVSHVKSTAGKVIATSAATTMATAAISSKNVMNLVHNVTVLSPPPVRRESIPIDVKLSEQYNEPPVQRNEPLEQRRGRTRTRTLEATEIVLLKPKGTIVEPSIVHPVMTTTTNQSPAKTTQIEAAPILKATTDTVMFEIKPSVSFEVMLNDDGTQKRAQNEVPKQIVDANTMDANKALDSDAGNDTDVVNESDNYEDDFESYESDFETDLSNGEDEEEEEEDNDANNSDERTQDETSISTGKSDTDDENVISTASKHPFETGHSIENGEFDSGSFEMKVLSARSRVDQHKTEHINVAAMHSDHQHELQNDSGIENFSNTVGVAVMAAHNGQMNSLDANNKTFDNISDIEVEGAAISLDAANGAIANTNMNTNTNKAVAGNKLNEQKPKPKSRLARRGEELLSKITLDVMNYVLFDFKPIPYELFMKIYGNSNTAQVAVQTHNDRIDQECQCDAIVMQTVWSQCPITYYTEHIFGSDFDDYKNGYGSAAMGTAALADTQNIDNIFDENHNQTCENSLSLIRKMAVTSNGNAEKLRDHTGHSGKLHINYVHLNRFLLESEMTLARILNIHNVEKRFRSLNESPLPISDGYLTLKPSLVPSFSANEKIERTFAIDSLPGFLFTLHFDSDSKLSVLALWHLSKLNEPVCLLSVWSKILCVEIHPKIRDIVFAGLDDGSIAVWDYSESKHWHPNLEDTIKRFVPSQITTPTFDRRSIELNDFGRCVAIKGLPIATDTELLNGYNPKQMCTLHECGLLILWTVLCNTTNTYTDLLNKRIEHQSLWSKVKLIQNKVIDLSASVHQMFQMKMVRPTSKSFDKTRSYFESELFSDSALQELHRMNADEEKLLTTFHCTAIQLTSDSILISTNENFVLLGRKSFKNESFRRIQIDSCKSVRVECMLSLIGFDDDIVVLVLNNGAVKSLCCDLSDEIDELQANSDIDDASSSTVSSLSPTTTAADAKASTAYTLPVDSIVFSVAPASNGPVQMMTAMAAPHQASVSGGFLTDGNSLGKSCTIQSLVLNERKIYDERKQALNHLENLEYNASFGGAVSSKAMMQKSIRCTHLMNGQTLFNNSMDLFSTPSVSHQHLVQLVKSNKLIILRKNRLRIYDLFANHMIEMPSNRPSQMYIDATTTTADHNEEYLVLLNNEGIVELHQIKI